MPTQPRLPGRAGEGIGAYESLSDAQRQKVPQVLRVWLRYRSEKYFGENLTPPGSGWK
jgi:hypothetical protein